MTDQEPDASSVDPLARGLGVAGVALGGAALAVALVGRGRARGGE